MRPFRFAIFVATTTGLLVLAVYLWTPLIGANLPNPTLARAPVASNSVESVKAAPGILKPPATRAVGTARPHRAKLTKPARRTALKILHVTRPAVSLPPRTANVPATPSGAASAAATIAPGGRLEHPASPPPPPAPIVVPPPATASPPAPARSSKPKPGSSGKPVPPAAIKPAPATTTTAPPATTPQPLPSPAATPSAPQTPQPSPAAAAPDVTSPATAPADTTRQTSTPPAVDPGPPAPPAPPPPAVPKFWLGYADTYEARGSALPAIWKGSPGVTFVGCGIDPTEDAPPRLNLCPQESSGPPGDSIDAGAIRIDNTSTVSSLVVTGPASVTIGSCVYTPWPGLKRTIPPGGTLILTQTGLTGNPCGDYLGGNYNFDTSESSGNGNCVPSPAIPVIALTINGTPTTIADSAQILNKHGTDPGACLGLNEFEDWSPVP